MDELPDLDNLTLGGPSAAIECEAPVDRGDAEDQLLGWRCELRFRDFETEMSEVMATAELSTFSSVEASPVLALEGVVHRGRRVRRCPVRSRAVRDRIRSARVDSRTGPAPSPMRRIRVHRMACPILRGRTRKRQRLQPPPSVVAPLMCHREGARMPGAADAARTFTTTSGCRSVILFISFIVGCPSRSSLRALAWRSE